MSATDIAAWWGGAIATLVLAWDVYKWVKHGPQLTCSVSPNMVMLTEGVQDESTFVAVRIRNRGDAATTLESMYLAHYRSWWHRAIARTDHLFVIPHAGITSRLPYVLEPGGVWDGRAAQDDSLEALANKGYFECRIYYSHGRRPIARRIGPILRQTSGGRRA